MNEKNLLQLIVPEMKYNLKFIFLFLQTGNEKLKTYTKTINNFVTVEKTEKLSSDEIDESLDNSYI